MVMAVYLETEVETLELEVETNWTGYVGLGRRSRQG